MPNREARMLLVSLPWSERVPPLIFRLTTGGRRLRSAALLSADARGSAMKVNSSGKKRSTLWHSTLMGVSLPRLADHDLEPLLLLHPPGCRTVSGSGRTGVLGLVIHFPHPLGPSGQALMFGEPLLQLVDVPQQSLPPAATGGGSNISGAAPGTRCRLRRSR